MSANEQQNQEGQVIIPAQGDENQQREEREVKETELNLESLEERISPMRVL